ncbi:arylsulfatase [Flammeovirga sp. SR4]|uniref:Arylsulfatase n=2 Tax=Flammeovirga agarivorans TaxID=2726742 RepID=A0A7X8XVS6_9BACT|nr:arylsulfatase [Flammeovirga agarivorans]
MITHQNIAQEKPNVILIFMDNYGWGEPGCYGGGILRGAPSPNIDRLAEQGMKLLNFNVEAQCTPSRAAILTGRYAIRTGNSSVPIESPVYGLTQWEYTMAEMFGDAGYSTGIFGKWHLGHTEGRFPTDQGFDEWYGIPNSSDECAWADDSRFRENVHPFAVPEYVMEGIKGQSPKKIKVYNTEARREIDGEVTLKAKEFMERKSKDQQPFFLFIPYTQTHMPVIPSEKFKGKSGNGDFADVLIQTDYYVGELMQKADDLGIAENTIFIFTSDNGPDPTTPHSSFAGPWSGSYFTGKEGSLRVPFIIRWPNKIKKGSANNEIVHEMDLLPTFSNIIQQQLPSDRIIDGIDQTDFFLGKQDSSNRESVIVYVGDELYGVKWRNYKMMSKEIDKAFADPTRTYGVPLMYDLHIDPKEENPLNAQWYHNTWIRWPAGEVLVNHLNTLKEEPPIKPGTLDPYLPSK